MTTCARGCVVPGRHLGACTCGSDGHQHDDTCHGCEGCQPREATIGQLCRSDVSRIERALLDAPQLAAWVRENVERGASTSDGPKAAGKRTPAPLNLSAVDDADAIAAVLWTWTEQAMDWAGMAGPGSVGFHVKPSAKTRTGTGEIVYRDPAVTGLRSDADPDETLGRLAAWMLDQIEELASMPAADELHDEITDTIREIRNRWPQADRNRKLPLPCPACDLAMLYLHPPAGPPMRDENGKLTWAHQHLVHCHNDDCGETMTNDSYYLAATTALAERKGKAA